MRKLEAVVRALNRDYSRLKTWRNVAARWGISAGMAYRIAHGYEPKDAHIRNLLDLPALVPAPVCHRCGQVHVTKRCTANRGYNSHRLFDLPVDVLAWKLQNREVV